MRSVIALFLCASPAVAWEAGRDGPVCFLSHETDEARVTVSHDISKSEPFAIELTLDGGWQAGPVFAIRFDGPGGRTITTDRHHLTDNTLTVTDTGFGNVLDGIALNFVAIAMSGETALVIPLDGAAPEVERFKACSAHLGA